jgi:hypothetical protein
LSERKNNAGGNAISTRPSTTPRQYAAPSPLDQPAGVVSIQTMTTPENPFQPSAWSSDLFREGAGHSGDRGLIGHVPIVAILLIVQGLAEIAFGVMGVGFYALIKLGPQKELGPMEGLGLILLAIGALALATGLLRIVAGAFNFRYRRRGLGMAALAIGLFTLATAYCAPTAIALAIYGLIVYVNEPVIMAFQMGDSGRPLAEIRAAYLARQA